MGQNRTIEVKHLGLVDYKTALCAQEAYHGAIVADKIKCRDGVQGGSATAPDYLLFCEHPPVYTLGSRGGMNHLLVDMDTLQDQSISFCHVNRGGGMTYHGPGQLVVYPIIDLEKFLPDIHAFFRLLESSVQIMLDYFNISTISLPGLTGVWARGEDAEQNRARKICAIGIRVSRWVTMHGLALNVNNNLAPFRQIIPCGMPYKQVTSMKQELQQSLSMEEVSKILEEALLTQLAYIDP